MVPTSMNHSLMTTKAEEPGEVEKLRARIGELERQITGGNA